MKATNIALLSVAFLSSVASASSITDIDIEFEPAVEEHWSGLPIWGVKAKELGYNLPLPLGIGLFANSQEVGYIAEEDFHLMAHGGLLGGSSGSAGYIVPKSDVDITGKDQSVQLRADAWLLPFLNVYGLAGYTEGTKDITVLLKNATTDEGKPLPFLNKIKAPITFKLDYHAYNVGVGAVAATQFKVNKRIKPIIVTVSGAVTNSWTNMTDSTILTTVGALRVGQRYDTPIGEIGAFAGYQYQNIRQNISGSINIDGSAGAIVKELDFQVGLRSQETHNASISMVYDLGLGDEWQVFAEYGFLNWKQVTVSAGYRF